MESYDLKPTTKNILATLKNDKIRRREYIIRFIDFLDNLNQNASISLDGDWGSGKTFFIKQIAYILLQTNKFIRRASNNDFELNELKSFLGEKAIQDRVLLPVYYNAWENDNNTDPVLTIIKEIIKAYSSSGKFEGDSNVKEGIKDIIKNLIASFSLEIPIQNSDNTSGSTILNISGVNIANIVDSFDKFKKENLLKQIEEQDSIKNKINELLSTLCIEKGDRFVIFIDELDRCKPTFAVNLLERIKHYFDNEYVIFIFSTNIIELQNTVKKYYGDNFDSFTYLDKFFDYKFSLPSPDIKNYLNFIEAPLSSSYVDEHILYIIEHFNLSMRNINHFLSTYKIVSYSFNNSQEISDEPGLLFCQECIIPILVYLFLFDKAKYISFMQGNEDTFFAELINNKKKDKYAEDFLNLAKNKSSPDPKDIETLKVMYKKLFSKEKYYKFYDNSKYQFPNWIKDKIEKSMSCFF